MCKYLYLTLVCSQFSQHESCFYNYLSPNFIQFPDVGQSLSLENQKNKQLGVNKAVTLIIKRVIL